MSYYQCQRCFFISKQKTGMIRHLDRKNKCIKNIQSYRYPDDELYTMSLEFIKKNNRLVSKIVTINSNKHQCKYCFKGFSTKGNLKKHINKHEDGSIPVLPEECYEDDDNYQIDIIDNESNESINERKSINNYNDVKTNIIQSDTEFVQYKDDDNKNYNQTINNITVNQQFNNYNIINMKYPNGFDKDWDLSKISDEKKLFLINTCNTKYSELLKFILQNDDNLNVIIENETNTGIVYKNDTEKYIHLNKSDIIDQSLTKLRLQLNSLCNEICVKKNGNVENIEKYQYETLSINKKFDDYSKNNHDIRNGVQDIISSVFNEKKDKTIDVMNKIIENETSNNLLKNGF
jgi:hypothetical protein